MMKDLVFLVDADAHEVCYREGLHFEPQFMAVYGYLWLHMAVYRYACMHVCMCRYALIYLMNGSVWPFMATYGCLYVCMYACMHASVCINLFNVWKFSLMGMTALSLQVICSLVHRLFYFHYISGAVEC